MIMNTDTEFLKNLKKGDSVILHFHSFSSSRDLIKKVQRITPKGYIKVDNMLFNPDTGRVRGDNSYSYYRLLEATPAAAKRIEENYYIQETFCKLNSIKKLTYEQARALRAVIDEIL